MGEDRWPAIAQDYHLQGEEQEEEQVNSRKGLLGLAHANLCHP
jgi:hypothetical protein